MPTLTEKLSQIGHNIFADCGLPGELGTVRVSDRPDLAQFQCNGAMSAAQAAKKNPRDLALELQPRFMETGLFEKVEIAGPGFINLDLKDKEIAQFIKGICVDPRFSIDISANVQHKKIILDYGGPNIAKPMHVGHLRSAVIGDCLRRLYLFAGYDALSDVHIGDWGLHMGMIVSEYLKNDDIERILATDLSCPSAVQNLMDELSNLYPQVSATCKEDEQRREEARKATLNIQQKEPAHYALWEKIRQASIISMRSNYSALDIHFDFWKGEADAHEYIEAMIENLHSKGLAYESEGALVIDTHMKEDKKEYPPLILYKSDGAVLYGTTDLATIVERQQNLSPLKFIYLADKRQSLHFEQVFRVARKASIVSDEQELIFAGFGTMNGTDGKPFKTRAGGVMKLEDLIAMTLEMSLSRMKEAEIASDMSYEEQQEIALKVAVSAIKYADLQNQRLADYIFDLDKFVQFEGKTGPYLLYQSVRINSLLNKATELSYFTRPSSKDPHSEGANPKDIPEIHISDDSRELALLACAYGDSLALTQTHLAPHYLCEYLFKLASSYSSFYGRCHILSEQDEKLRRSYLQLSWLTYSILDHGLGLLGIRAPLRM